MGYLKIETFHQPLPLFSPLSGQYRTFFGPYQVFCLLLGLLPLFGGFLPLSWGQHWALLFFCPYMGPTLGSSLFLPFHWANFGLFSFFALIWGQLWALHFFNIGLCTSFALYRANIGAFGLYRANFQLSTFFLK